MVYLHKFIHRKKMILWWTMMNSKVNLKSGIYNVIILLYFFNLWICRCGFYTTLVWINYTATHSQDLSREARSQQRWTWYKGSFLLFMKGALCTASNNTSLEHAGYKATIRILSKQSTISGRCNSRIKWFNDPVNISRPLPILTIQESYNL